MMMMRWRWRWRKLIGYLHTFPLMITAPHTEEEGRESSTFFNTSLVCYICLTLCVCVCVRVCVCVCMLVCLFVYCSSEKYCIVCGQCVSTRPGQTSTICPKHTQPQ